jgi:hypothetical protein
MISKTFAVMGALTLLSATAHAGSAPKELYGKSIILTWTEYQNVRCCGRPNFRDVVIQFSRKIYISTAGRPFSRFGQTSPAGEGTHEEVGSSGINAQGGPTQTLFSGRTMTILGSSGGHARRTVVNFNENFSTCDTQIVFAKQAGLGVVMGRNMHTGEPVEMRSSKVTNVSCSVRDGNVFAQ